MSFPVFFDTCTLFGELVNDLILRLAEEHLYAPYWSQQILDELRRNLQLRIGEERSAQRVNAMTAAFPEALATGYESLIKNMTCDEKTGTYLQQQIIHPHKPWSPSTRKIFLKLRHSLFASK